MGGAAIVVDVDTVGLGVDPVDFSPLSLEGRRRCLEGGSIGTIHNDLDSFETHRPLKAVDQVRHVRLDQRFIDTDAPDGRSSRPGPDLGKPRLDGLLELVVQLVAAPREELNAVVGHGVVAGRQHHTKIGIAGFGKKRHPGSRQNAESYHIDTGAGQTGHDRGLQELTGSPGIPANERYRRISGELPALIQYVGRGNRKAKRELRGKCLVGLTAYPVGPEESPHWSLSARLPLAVLGSLPGLLQTRLLTFLDPRVTGQQAGLLQRGTAGFGINGIESTRDT
jgi:hypothetical protein